MKLQFKNAYKSILMMIFDAVAVNIAFIISFIVRYYAGSEISPGSIRLVNIFLRFAPIYALICVIVFCFLGVYKIRWEYAGIKDLNRIVLACTVTSIFYVVGTVIIFEWMTISYYCLGIFFQYAIVLASRLGYKLYLMERHQFVTDKKASVNIMLVGTEGIAQYVKNTMLYWETNKVVCILDLQSSNAVQYINGIPVFSSIEYFEKMLIQYSVDIVVLADVNLMQKDEDVIRGLCDKNGTEVQNYVDFLLMSNDVETRMATETENGQLHVIPFSPPDISEKEINEVNHVMRSGWITTGPRTKEFERKLAEYCHVPKVVCLSSATAAEELNLRVCGIGPGDEVIVPAYTYTATASAVIHCGANVIFVDSHRDSYEMDYDKVTEAINEKTKAIVAVDIAGIIVDYDRLYEIVESKRNLFTPKEGDDLGSRIQRAYGRVLVFADCAHALGASRKGKMAGEIADFSDFSFHAVKNLTTGEGGAATWKDIPGIDSDEIYQQYQLYSLHGQSKDALSKTKLGAWEYDIVGPWYKCNMTDIMAGIGLKQLERYPNLIKRRYEIIKCYDEMCDEIGVMHLKHAGRDYTSSGHLYLTRIPGITTDQRQEIIVKMAEKGVSTNVHYKPLPMMTAYRNMGWDINDFPNAYEYYSNLITLPLHTNLSDSDVEYVIKCYKEVVTPYIVER